MSWIILCISVVSGKSSDAEKSSAEKFWIAHIVQGFLIIVFKTENAAGLLVGMVFAVVIRRGAQYWCSGILFC